MNANSQIRQDAQSLLSQSIEHAKVEHIEYRTPIASNGFYFLTVNIHGTIFASTNRTNIADAVKDILQKVSEDKATDKEYHTLRRSDIVDCMAWTIEEKIVKWMADYHNTKPSFSFIATVCDIKYYVDVDMNELEKCISVCGLSWKFYPNISDRLSLKISAREKTMLLRYAGEIHEQREEQQVIRELRDEYYAQMAMSYADTFSL